MAKIKLIKLKEHRQRVAMAYASGLSIRECTEKFSIAKTTVKRCLDEYGVPARGKDDKRNVNRSKSDVSPKVRVKTRHTPSIPEVSPSGRKETKSEILDRAKLACGKLGGCAEIGEGFFIVDSSKFEIKMKVK